MVHYEIGSRKNKQIDPKLKNTHFLLEFFNIDISLIALVMLQIFNVYHSDLFRGNYVSDL